MATEETGGAVVVVEIIGRIVDLLQQKCTGV